MKQYLNSEQTSKLIGLGFEKPKSISSIKVPGNIITTADDLIGEPSSVMGGKITANYSIGELIEMLPENVAKENEIPSTLNISLMNGEWCVQYADFLGTDFEFCDFVLIDALYDMVVKLKEEEII